VRPFSLPPTLAREVCDRLDAPWPSSFDAIETLYRRWCSVIPFDTIAKAAAVARDDPPPGSNAVEVVETWLATGVGGTCWGRVNAFAGLLASAGIDATAGLDRMQLADGRVDFHSVVVVRDDLGAPSLCDFTHVSDRPLALVPGSRRTQGPYEVGIDADGEGRVVHWFRNPERASSPPADQRAPDADTAGDALDLGAVATTRYIVLSTVLDLDDVRAFCAVATRFSGVSAHKLYSRRFPDDRFVSSRPTPDGRALLVATWDAQGCTRCAITDLDEAFTAMGYNAAGRLLAERAGLVRTERDGSVRYRL